MAKRALWVVERREMRGWVSTTFVALHQGQAEHEARYCRDTDAEGEYRIRRYVAAEED